MHAWFRDLIRLRRRSQSLNDGDKGHVKVRFDEEKRWLAMDRGLVTVLCNLGADTPEFDVPEGARVVLTSVDGLSPRDGTVSVPPDGFVILSAEEDY
jgi:maltooligosyltrehalose trehalohydrolase